MRLHRGFRFARPHGTAEASGKPVFFQVFLGKKNRVNQMKVPGANCVEFLFEVVGYRLCLFYRPFWSQLQAKVNQIQFKIWIRVSATKTEGIHGTKFWWFSWLHSPTSNSWQLLHVDQREKQQTYIHKTILGNTHVSSPCHYTHTNDMAASARQSCQTYAPAAFPMDECICFKWPSSLLSHLFAFVLMQTKL